MTNLNDRQRAFEDKFARDQEFKFRVVAHRNKLLGIWAGRKLGKPEDQLDAYAKSVVVSDFAEPGDEDVLRKVFADFEQAGLGISREELRQQMDTLMEQAKADMADKL